MSLTYSWLSQVIMDAFHAEKDAAKKAIAKAAAEGAPPLDPLLLAEVTAYYNEYNPLFANQTKIGGIVRTFQNKAKKAGTPDEWREMLYAALGGKAGCEGATHPLHSLDRPPVRTSHRK